MAGSNASRVVHLEGLLRSSEAVYERMMVRPADGLIANRQSLEALQGHLTSLMDAIGTAGRNRHRSGLEGRWPPGTC